MATGQHPAAQRRRCVVLACALFVVVACTVWWRSAGEPQPPVMFGRRSTEQLLAMGAARTRVGLRKKDLGVRRIQGVQKSAAILGAATKGPASAGNDRWATAGDADDREYRSLVAGLAASIAGARVVLPTPQFRNIVGNLIGRVQQLNQALLPGKGITGGDASDRGDAERRAALIGDAATTAAALRTHLQENGPAGGQPSSLAGSDAGSVVAMLEREIQKARDYALRTEMRARIVQGRAGQKQPGAEEWDSGSDTGHRQAGEQQPSNGTAAWHARLGREVTRGLATRQRDVAAVVQKMVRDASPRGAANETVGAGEQRASPAAEAMKVGERAEAEMSRRIVADNTTADIVHAVRGMFKRQGDILNFFGRGRETNATLGTGAHGREVARLRTLTKAEESGVDGRFQKAPGGEQVRDSVMRTLLPTTPRAVVITFKKDDDAPKGGGPTRPGGSGGGAAGGARSAPGVGVSAMLTAVPGPAAARMHQLAASKPGSGAATEAGRGAPATGGGGGGESSASPGASASEIPPEGWYEGGYSGGGGECDNCTRERALQMFGKWLLIVLSMVVSVMLCALLGFLCFGCLWWCREFRRQDRWDKLVDAAEAAAGGGGAAPGDANTDGAPAPPGGGSGGKSAGPAYGGKGAGPAGPAPGGAAPEAPGGGRAISRRSDSGMTR